VGERRFEGFFVWSVSGVLDEMMDEVMMMGEVMVGRGGVYSAVWCIACIAVYCMGCMAAVWAVYYERR